MAELQPLSYGPEATDEHLEKIAAVGETMLRDLHDMALKWGNVHVQREDLFILNPQDFGVKSEIFVEAKAKPEDLRLIVSRGEERFLKVSLPPFSKGRFEVFFLKGRQIIEETPLGISYPRTLPEIAVTYDTELALEEVFDLMIAMMVVGSEKGLVEKGGVRRENPDRKYFVPTKLKIEEVFKEEGSCVALLPDIEISDTLEQFDRPEELVVIENPYTGNPDVITHRKWLEYHELRFKIINEVFLEMGLNPLDLVGAAVEDPRVFEPLISKLREEIDRRMKEAWAKRENPQK